MFLPAKCSSGAKEGSFLTAPVKGSCSERGKLKKHSKEETPKEEAPKVVGAEL